MNQQIIAVDFHCKFQKVAWLDPPGGEIREADVRQDSTKAVPRTAQFTCLYFSLDIRRRQFYYIILCYTTI